MIRIALIALALSACSPGVGAAQSAPTPQMAREAFRQAYQRKVPQGINYAVQSFEKTNGLAVPNRQGYQMWYRAVVVYPQGKYPECVPGPGRFSCGPNVPNPLPVGATVPVQGILSFQKTERGWMLVDDGLGF